MWGTSYTHSLGEFTLSVLGRTGLDWHGLGEITNFKKKKSKWDRNGILNVLKNTNVLSYNVNIV
jgi:hypothetical protein